MIENKKVKVYILDDGFDKQLVCKEDIIKRADELLELPIQPTIEQAIRGLDNFYGEDVEEVITDTDTLNYLTYYAEEV